MTVVTVRGEVIGGRPADPAVAANIVGEEARSALRRGMGVLETDVKNRQARRRRTGNEMRQTSLEIRREGTDVVGELRGRAMETRLLEEGTGIYGPRHRMIRPRRARALRFPEAGNPGFTLAGRQRAGRRGRAARWIYARQIRGIRARHTFEDAQSAVGLLVIREMDEGGRRAANRLGSR